MNKLLLKEEAISQIRQRKSITEETNIRAYYWLHKTTKLVLLPMMDGRGQTKTAIHWSFDALRL
jgi:hypothetical protein